jgi:hypothetical protein
MRRVLALAALAAVCVLPTAAACVSTGGKTLAPGDELDVTDHICTLGFLVADSSGLYFSTAGHCIHVNDTASNPTIGKFGVGAFHYLVPETGSESDGSPGEDFALIRIDPADYAQVSPTVCGWGGPKGLYTDTPGSGGVKHYGSGEGMTVAGPTTQQRQGFNLLNNNTAFYWTGAGVPGDSGSAVLSDDLRAVGVLTHLIVSPPSDNGGTHLLRGFQLASAAGFHLRLVLDGEDPVQVLAQMQANATNGSAPPTVTMPTTGAGTSANGTANGTQPGSPPPTSSPAPGQTSPTPPPSADQGQGLQPASDGGATKKAPAPEPALLLLGVVGAAVARRLR